MRSRLLVFCAACVLAGCGTDDTTIEASEITDPAETTTSSTIALPSTTLPTKPSVQIPTEPPTELGITVLRAGTGAAAAEGDTVVVNYVGVRSLDGTEFDNSYDRGEPFPVENVGQAQVIDGWNQGLIGAQTGAQIQLDIPAELAYGENPNPGGVIQPNDPLTFVIDVVVVIPTIDPASAPEVAFTPLTGPATGVTTEDLVVGEGPELAYGNTAYVNVIAIDPTTGTVLQSSWDSGAAVQLAFGSPESLAGLNEGLVGMKVGGRRQVVLPAAKAYGADGNPGLGVAPDADVAFIIDLVAAY
jgi:peptidylprolyl isomerase